MPPLEAMACGTSVITAANDGVKEYAIDGANFLMYKPGDIKQLINCLKIFINNEELCRKLNDEGIKTALKYNWENTANLLLKEFFENIKARKTAILK